MRPSTLLALALLASLGSTASAADGVIPPHARAFGSSYGHLAQGWVAWAYEGTDTNPLTDETGEDCAVRQADHLWYLAGTGYGEVERTCSVPPGTALFFPVVNLTWFQYLTDPAFTEAEIHSMLGGMLDTVCDLHASVDGVELDLSGQRIESPAFALTLSDDRLYPSVEDVGEGPIYPVVNDGWFVLLAPLSRGEHVVEFGGSPLCGTDWECSIQATYYLTVE